MEHGACANQGLQATELQCSACQLNCLASNSCMWRHRCHIDISSCRPQERLPLGLKLRCVEAASVVLQAEHRYTAKLTLAEAPEGEQASGAQQQSQQQQPSDPEQKAGPAGQAAGTNAAGQSQHQVADQLHPRPNRRPRARHRDPGQWRWRLISFELLPGAEWAAAVVLRGSWSLPSIDSAGPGMPLVCSCRCSCGQASGIAAKAKAEAGLWGSQRTAQRIAQRTPTAMP